jgi:DNA-binding NarL/FixJ family response regulator
MTAEGSSPRVYPSRAEWVRVARTWRWSRRERQVVQLLTRGRSRKEAARVLGISASTLLTYLQRSLSKAGASDLIDLVWRIVAVRDLHRHSGTDKEAI